MTFARMRAALNRASALDTLVYSPGSVGRNPFSVMYSSSASTGYSQWTSTSLTDRGSPSCAAVKQSRVYRVQNNFFLVSTVKVPKVNRFCD